MLSSVLKNVQIQLSWRRDQNSDAGEPRQVHLLVCLPQLRVCLESWSCPQILGLEHMGTSPFSFSLSWIRILVYDLSGGFGVLSENAFVFRCKIVNEGLRVQCFSRDTLEKVFGVVQISLLVYVLY